MLTNAVYFKGDWVRQFNSKKTQEQDFTVSAERKVKAPLMYQPARFGYGVERTFEVLELPYSGQEFSMVVLLPKKVDGLQALEMSLDLNELDGCLAGSISETS